MLSSSPILSHKYIYCAKCCVRKRVTINYIKYYNVFIYFLKMQSRKEDEFDGKAAREGNAQ